MGRDLFQPTCDTDEEVERQCLKEITEHSGEEAGYEDLIGDDPQLELGLHETDDPDSTFVAEDEDIEDLVNQYSS
tara:strand:- start:243 stop:467 length:225 start_codon:yes stop_codon:yes gene_type:complete